MLFGWGTNSNGQLGQGNESELVPIPTPSFLPSELQATILNSGVTGGGNHSVICSQNGNVWGAGLDNYGQISCSETKSVNLFSKIDSLTNRNIFSVACGWDFSLFITSNGSLYGMGSNTFSQLGISNKISSGTDDTQAVEEHNKFVQVSAGLRHAAAITDIGLLKVWGAEKYVKLTSGLFSVTKVSCGQRHIVALDTENNLIAWGANHHGQCGQNNMEMKFVQDPLVVKWNKQNGEIVDIVCGWTHCILLTDQHQVFTWGRNTYGQLGRESSSDFYIPTRVTGLENIIAIRAGSEHSMALDKYGQLWTWGWNEHGSCGNGSVENQHRPVNISGHFPGRIRSIGSGAGHSFAIVE